MFVSLLIRITVLIAIALASFSVSTKENTNSSPLRIAVAANFAPVLHDLLPDFTLKTGIETQVIVGSTGTLFQQIQHGAPFDVFLSADKVRPKLLEQNNLITPNSRQTYALGGISYWSATHQVNSIDELATPPHRFAIANPKIAPYGKAAQEVLKSLSLWQSYQPSLVRGININQTFQQVRSQSVQSGIVATSQLVLNNLSGVEIPTSLYQPIRQQLVIIKASQKHEQAKTFVRYLLRESTQQKIVKMGYLPYER